MPDHTRQRREPAIAPPDDADPTFVDRGQRHDVLDRGVDVVLDSARPFLLAALGELEAVALGAPVVDLDDSEAPIGEILQEAVVIAIVGDVLRPPMGHDDERHRPRRPRGSVRKPSTSVPSRDFTRKLSTETSRFRSTFSPYRPTR